jgi:acyl-CoA synthetase (AMP-forming)/AMP-acid ligase II
MLSNRIQHAYGRNPDAVVLVKENVPNPGQEITLADLKSRIRYVTRLVKPGSVVATVLDISIEAVVWLVGVIEAGGSIMPLNPEMAVREFTESFSFGVDSLVVSDKEPSRNAMDAATSLSIPVRVAEVMRSSINEEIDYIQYQKSGGKLILFTSGTTSGPKAVPLTESNLLASVDNILECLCLTSSDSTMCVMPLFHIHGIVACVLSTLCSGGKLILPNSGKFSARRFLPVMRFYGCSWYTGVPTIHQLVLGTQGTDEAPLIPALKFIRSSSAKLHVGVLERMEHAFQVPVIEAYAMTETAYQITSNPASLAKRRPETVGITFGSVAIKISEFGEVCVKGPNVTSGYLGNQVVDAFTSDGYFRTGDLGELDSHGYLIITGRIKEQINRAGEKISPLEIDNILKQHSSVNEAVCFGYPDPLYGESIAAAIVSNNANLTKEDLVSFLSDRVVRFKMPSRWFLVPSLPRTSTGKVQRTTLAKHFGLT